MAFSRWSPLGRSRSMSGHSQRSSERKRSEEHTSELQSRLHLVCRLLLAKKKHAQRHPVWVEERPEHIAFVRVLVAVALGDRHPEAHLAPGAPVPVVGAGRLTPGLEQDLA